MATEIERLEYELLLTQRVLGNALMALNNMNRVLGRYARASEDVGAAAEVAKTNQYLNAALEDIDRLRALSRKLV